MYVKVPRSDFNKSWVFFKRFSKNTQISNFRKIHPAGTELFHSNPANNLTHVYVSGDIVPILEQLKRCCSTDSEYIWRVRVHRISKIQGVRKVSWNKFQTKDAQILGTTIKISVAMVTWSMTFLHPCISKDINNCWWTHYNILKYILYTNFKIKNRHIQIIFQPYVTYYVVTINN